MWHPRLTSLKASSVFGDGPDGVEDEELGSLDYRFDQHPILICGLMKQLHLENCMK